MTLVGDQLYVADTDALLRFTYHTGDTRIDGQGTKVLDLPGGMRIGTIHAFCQSLLRRFPLEAEISPHFQLAQDRDAEEAMTEAREDLLGSIRPRGVDVAMSDQEIAQFGLTLHRLEHGAVAR